MFRAEANSEYLILIDHKDDFTSQPVLIFAPDGKAQVHEHWPTDRRNSVSYTPWVAPESGYYYVAFRSPDGDTGRYTLTVQASTAGNDDHGDTPGTGTEISVDQVVSRSLDHDNDFDYFRFRARFGQEYEIRASFPLSRTGSFDY